jgi:ubiquinone/menaquinone biosynthesis C-methylase UbiE
MKTRESGMPDVATWETFFDAGAILRALGLISEDRDVVDFGCGYGTFVLSAARMVRGTVHALDIEPEMIETTARKAKEEGLDNVKAVLRDFMNEGTGLADGSVDYAMIFNILHAEHPEVLLKEALRILTTGGRLSVIHWNYDPDTPRGPPVEIRPRPGDCISWAEDVGFKLFEPGVIDLPPYHYGLVFRR